MSTTTDVGDAFVLTFTTTTGATVTASWYDPNGVAAFESQPAAESPAGSGQFPVTLTATGPGIWRATFRATGPVTQSESIYVKAYPIDGPSPLATVGEVREIQGNLTADQENLAAVLLRRASAMVRARFPYLAQQIADGALDPDTVGTAVVQMVLRVMRNPAGLRAQTIGPFSRAFDTSLAAGELVIAPQDIVLVTPTVVEVPAATIMARPGLAPARDLVRRVSRW